jgi:hypothetical protein
VADGFSRRIDRMADAHGIRPHIAWRRFGALPRGIVETGRAGCEDPSSPYHRRQLALDPCQPDQSNARSGKELDEQINVALRAISTLQHGTERRQTFDAVSSAEFGGRIRIALRGESNAFGAGRKFRENLREICARLTVPIR